MLVEIFKQALSVLQVIVTFSFCFQKNYQDLDDQRLDQPTFGPNAWRTKCSYPMENLGLV